MVREIMLLPYHVEKFNILIDLDETSLLKQFENFAEEMYKNVLKKNFPQTINKIFLLGIRVLGSTPVFKWNRKTCI